ncbi:MAG: 2-C-methyl-D-erythritol 4-phosphate cytidylyltransferase [Candidatus Obscuribacterales bacterium]|nr:2-C-methyl-D-erythritol 4-phosphate cytidylyltransferase [Candidatus Obscuribacterales bacterium]
MPAAILLAAGIGARCAKPGDKSPKQFLSIGKHPVWVWPYLALSNHKDINQIVVATLPEMVDTVRQYVEKIPSSKEVIVTTGGATRQESVRLSLNVLDQGNNKPDYVLVHDAARPFLTEQIISDTLEGVRKYGACTIGVTASDTVKKVTDGVIVETLDRNTLVLVQTPQAARFDWLLKAHEQARQDGSNVTDDAAILEQAGHKVVVVKGSAHNLKITEPEDLALADALASIVFERV